MTKFSSITIIILSLTLNGNSFLGDKKKEVDWYEIENVNQKIFYYIDLDKLSRTPDGTIKYWLLTDFDKTGHLAQVKEFIELDCRKIERKNISRYDYESSKFGSRKWIKKSVLNPGVFVSFKYEKNEERRAKKVCEIVSNKFK